MDQGSLFRSVAALANEFKKIKRRLSRGLPETQLCQAIGADLACLLAQPHVDVCVAQRLLGSRLRPARWPQLWVVVVVVQQPGQATQTKKRGDKSG